MLPGVEGVVAAPLGVTGRDDVAARAIARGLARREACDEDASYPAAAAAPSGNPGEVGVVEDMALSNREARSPRTDCEVTAILRREQRKEDDGASRWIAAGSLSSCLLPSCAQTHRRIHCSQPAAAFDLVRSARPLSSSLAGLSMNRYNHLSDPSLLTPDHQSKARSQCMIACRAAAQRVMSTAPSHSCNTKRPMMPLRSTPLVGVS